MTDELHKPDKTGDFSVNLREHVQQSLENALIGKTVFPEDQKHAQDNLDWPTGFIEGTIVSLRYSFPELVELEIKFPSNSTEVHYIGLANLAHYNIK